MPMREAHAVTVNLFRLRSVAKSYAEQRLLAQKVGRLKEAVRLISEEGSAPPTHESRRRAMVERVAQEIIDNLLVTGADSPVVADIHRALEEEFDTRFVFGYPVMEHDLQIYRSTDAGPEQLSAPEADRVMERLWQITVRKVDETML